MVQEYVLNRCVVPWLLHLTHCLFIDANCMFFIPLCRLHTESGALPGLIVYVDCCYGMSTANRQDCPYDDNVLLAKGCSVSTTDRIVCRYNDNVLLMGCSMLPADRQECLPL